MVRLTILAAALALSSAASKHQTITDLLKNAQTVDAREALDTPLPQPADMWFEGQLLDHTDAANSKTWKQRYHFNKAWFGGRSDSPVFVYINGENVADPNTTISSSYFMNELAQKYGALTVSLEHRFYGQSQPTGDLSCSDVDGCVCRLAKLA
ncbi:hypothetical protein As57867_007535, partial [Aphanomyces stellatus]